jgi:hypothetical protein
MVEPGTILVEKYRIERVLAKGGMGVVARAHHLILDVPVAIKFLLPDALEQEETVQRFLREAQAAARLKGEHVSRIIDVGTLETGAPYLVMEYLEGVDLKDLLRRRGRLDPGFAVDLTLQACEALAEAHALGIVHRDVKPSNFFLTQGADGAPLLKLIDFGVSKVAGPMTKGITNSQVIIGTPAYMSPEQMASSKNVDARTDIWSLGVLLYELVAGRRPFRGDSFGPLVVRVTTQPMTPLDDVELPEGLAAVIARCLEKEADHRFQTTAELAAALASYAGTPSQAARALERTARMLELATASGVAVPLVRDAQAASSDTAYSTIRRSSGELTVPRAPRRRYRTLVATGGAALLGMAAALVVVMRAEHAAEHAPAPGGAAQPAPDEIAGHAPPEPVQRLDHDAGAPSSIGTHASDPTGDPADAPATASGDDAAHEPEPTGEAASAPAAAERESGVQPPKRRKPTTDGKAARKAGRGRGSIEDAFGTRK